MPEALKTTIGFLGAGRMATALARGWVQAGLIHPEHCQASDPSPEARAEFTRQTGCVSLTSNREVTERSKVLILAVKPQTMPALLEEIRPVVRDSLIVSIAAGITLTQLTGGLGPSCRLVRVMPNTPCLVGAGAAGYSPGDHASEADVAVVDLLLNSVGRAFHVPEPLLDAVTGLSGSGPAFVALMIEALADGGVRAGLPRNVASTLAAQTVLGTAQMILKEGFHPGVLKDMVASPAGTTIAGLHALERAGVRGAFMDAVSEATRRAEELGR
jgi:pyrroline-5-carboxylate reductase